MTDADALAEYRAALHERADLCARIAHHSRAIVRCDLMIGAVLVCICMVGFAATGNLVFLLGMLSIGWIAADITLSDDRKFRDHERRAASTAFEAAAA